MRLTGQRKPQKWLGKCWYIGGAPGSIVSKFVCFKLGQFGMLNLENTSSVDGDIFDIRYIICLNDDLMSTVPGDVKKVEDIVLLHELMHINQTGDGIVKHDIEDFMCLIDKYGAHWSEGIFPGEKDSFSSLTSKSEYWEPPESS